MATNFNSFDAYKPPTQRGIDLQRLAGRYLKAAMFKTGTQLAALKVEIFGTIYSESEVNAAIAAYPRVS